MKFLLITGIVLTVSGIVSVLLGTILDSTQRCEGCGLHFNALYHYHGDWRCPVCVARRNRVHRILDQLERDGIITIVKES